MMGPGANEVRSRVRTNLESGQIRTNLIRTKLRKSDRTRTIPEGAPLKIQCQTKELLEAVQLAAGVVPNNATRPILQTRLLHADSTGLLVQGTDLEVGLSARVDEVIGESEGRAAIPAARLQGILRESRSEQVSIELIDDHVRLRAGSSRFKVPVLPADEFPQLEFRPPTPALRLEREPLLGLLRRVAVAATRDATRFQMHSVLIDCHGDRLRLVSTDGKRMAVGELPLDEDRKQGISDDQYILPLKGVELLTRILDVETENEIELHLDQNEITYTSDRISLSSRLVEGRYPEYERAIPGDLEHIYSIDTESLLVGLRQASLMTTKETNSVRFAFKPDGVELSTAASNVGESHIEVVAKQEQGDEEEFAIHFNPGYLIDLLRVLDSPQVICSFRDRKTAGLFSLPEGGPEYRHIVMPLVVQEGVAEPV